MDLIKTLKQTGLSENQASVYIATLQLGVDTVLNISRSANLKRPTVYLILDDLERRGLVSKTIQRNKILYEAESPERLLTDLKTKTQLVKGILPSLKAIHNIDPEKPNIKIAEGVSGVRSVYNGIFTYLSHHPQEELIIYGSLKDAAEHFETSVVDYFYQIMAKSNNPIREIGNDDHETRKYYKTSSKLNPQHNIRLIRNEGRFFQTDNMLYGNTLIIFSVKEQIFATIIESPNIAETYKTLFNMAWNSGRML
ncbi:MAG TPA: hypothetical protein DCS29_04630 [Candidatus Magasanikbacteria bacterium]|nr:MAG: hypothetical protein A2479_03970 [Candidatus Magasanikbacteria bacterium RIFOXYC2_FULL_39_8]HAT04026.1 hypothetical protein [Candidatus Magasanikbacteria bacterium]